MDTKGVHIIADFWGCAESILDDPELLMNALRNAATKAEMTILGEEEYRFSPQGFTGLLLLSESHISIHTYPEKGYAAIDIFTCGEKKTDLAITHLKMVLFPEKVKEITLSRGVI